MKPARRDRRPVRLGAAIVRADRNEIETPELGITRVEPRSMEVLELLIARAGEVVGREEIIEEVWEGAAVTDNVISRSIWELRRALCESGREPRIILTVPRRGYRLEIPVPIAGEAVEESGSRHPSIAVLPFLDLSPERGNEYLADGLVEELIHALTRTSSLRVVSRTSVFEFKGAGRDVREIGARLGVELLLEGSLRAVGERLRILARLVQVETGLDLWAETFDRHWVDFIEVQRAIASAIVRRLRDRMPSAAPRRRAAADRSLEAQHEYLKGRYFAARRTAQGLERAIHHFRRCHELEPDDARSLAGLADAHLLLAVYGFEAPATAVPAARRAAEEAVTRDGDLAEALTSLGLARAIYDWAWEDSEKSFLRAIEADPEYPTAHQWLAINVEVPQHRFADAVRRLAWAVELDPLSRPVHLSLGIAHYYAGDLTAATDRLRQTLDLDPVFAPPHLFRGLTMVAAGQPDEGVGELRQALTLSGEGDEALSALGYAHAVAGQRQAAGEVLGELGRRAAERYLSPVLRAQVLAGLGETEAALDALGEAVAMRASDAVWIGVRPTFHALRRERRFLALCRQMGLPAGGESVS